MRGRNFFDDYEEFGKPKEAPIATLPAEKVKEADEVKPGESKPVEITEEQPAEKPKEDNKGGEENGVSENE